MNKKDSSIELLRIIAIWAVVMIHVTSTTLGVSGYYLHFTPFTFFLNQASRFAVPLFFLISGYVLSLRYSVVPNLLTFYKKRFLRLALPFLVWSFIYYSIVSRAGIKAFFVNSPAILLSGTGAEHLYFIPAIMLLYLLFPLLSYFLYTYPPKKHFLSYFLFLTLTCSLLFLDYYTGNLPMPNPLRIALLNLPIFAIGMIWAKGRDSINTFIKKPTILIFISVVFFISFLLVIFEGYALSLNGYYLNYFMSQWRPSVFIYTLCIFALGVMYLPKIRIRIPSFFSSVTFFVFFIHIIFIHLFWRILGAYLFSRSTGHVVEQIWLDPLVFLFVIFCSYFSAFCVSRIPLLRDLLGIS